MYSGIDMTLTLAELAKANKGHEKYRQQTLGHDYTNVTFEFKYRVDARRFMRDLQGRSLSKYSPFFCDEFKHAQVTVFEPLEKVSESDQPTD